MLKGFPVADTAHILIILCSNAELKSDSHMPAGYYQAVRMAYTLSVVKTASKNEMIYVLVQFLENL